MTTKVSVKRWKKLIGCLLWCPHGFTDKPIRNGGKQALQRDRLWERSADFFAGRTTPETAGTFADYVMAGGSRTLLGHQVFDTCAVRYRRQP